MPLQLSFIAPAKKKKPAKLDIHLVVDDGCKVDLEKAVSQLTPIQKGVVMTQKPQEKHHLLYFNLEIVEGAHFAIHNAIHLKCPVCRKEYDLTKNQYDRELHTYLRKNKISLN